MQFKNAKEYANEIASNAVFDKYRFDCLRQVLGSVFIYDDKEQIPEKYSKTEYLKYEHDKQSLDKIDKDKFLQSERLKIFIDALDTCPTELFVYMDYENGDIVFKMEYKGHTPKPLMKIEFAYPDYDFKLLV